MQRPLVIQVQPLEGLTDLALPPHSRPSPRPQIDHSAACVHTARRREFPRSAARPTQAQTRAASLPCSADSHAPQIRPTTRNMRTCMQTFSCTRRWGSTRTTYTAAGVASSGGRGRARMPQLMPAVSQSSAAACPSVIGRPNAPASFTTARRPRTRTAERLLAGRRGRRCTLASCAGQAGMRGGRRRRPVCERRARGGGGLAGTG